VGRWRPRPLFLLSGVLVACAHHEPSPPRLAVSTQGTSTRAEDAVLPYSYELEQAQPLQPPFLARFERGPAHLLFVAAEHGCDPRTFRLIDDVLAAHHVGVVVVEGYPAAKGVNPQGYSRHLQEWAASGFCRGGGEGAYAASHGRERGASFVGGEPDEKVVAQAVLEQGFTAEDLLGFYFVRQLPQLRREGALESNGLDASFHTLIEAMEQRAGLEGTAFSLDRFRDWYQRKQGKPFDAATLDDEEPAPIGSGRYFTQRISSVVGIVRDRFIVQRISALLASDKDLLVVYGGSHFVTQRPAFEVLLGKAVELRPADPP